MKFFILLFLLSSIFGKSNEVNYQNKQLHKQLLKLWGVEFLSLIELTELTDNIISEGKIFRVEKENKLIGFVYVGRVISCREGGCAKDKTASISDIYEYFDMFIIYNDKKDIEQVKVFNYQATHGQEVCSKGWLKQFIGNGNLLPLEVGKSIDGISGATISVNAITDEVNYINGLIIAY